MKIPTNNITAGVISLLALTMSGTAYVFAGETSGTITAQSSPSHSSIEGTLSAGNPATTTEEVAAEATPSARSGGRSSMRSGSVPLPNTGSSPADNVIILNDGSIASTSGLNGTGGGFDQDLEVFLADESNGDNGISPEDAIAYNSSQNPLLANTDLTAATGNSGVSAGKIWTAVILGLLLVGLSGYAVYTLAGYKRENEL